MSIAIVGAGGFVGSRLIESFVLDGRRGIRAVVRSFRNIAGFCQYGPAVDVRRADAEHASALHEAIAGCHTVVNVTTGAPAGIVRSTEAILDACATAGVRRFIHLSSAVVYGDVPTPIGDDAPPVAGHWMPYARAKAASEIWLRERLDNTPVDVVVLRPGIVWGVGSPHTLHLAQRLAGKSAFLVGEGRGIFNGVYIDNLVAGIRRCSEHSGSARGFYNIGDAEAVTWRELFDLLGPALDCTTDRLPRVSADIFPRSIGSTIDTIQSLPMMNELYHRLKTRVPDGLKAAIRSKLEGRYEYERHATVYAAGGSVDREWWHLQRVAHKLPVAKLGQTFDFAPPVSVREGARRTLTWLASLGMVSPSFPPLQD